MTIYIDSVTTHGTSGVGDDTTPPGVTPPDWCVAVSDASLLDLTAFLTLNVLTVGQPATNVRTPLLGSLMTYVGLSQAQATAAIAAGAALVTERFLKMNCFDSPGWRSTFEP